MIVAPIQRTPMLSSTDTGVLPQHCSIRKKISCGAAIAACGSICYASLGVACVSCLDAIGESRCLDCF